MFLSITDSIKSPSIIDLAKNGSIGILTKNNEELLYLLQQYT